MTRPRALRGFLAACAALLITPALAVAQAGAPASRTDPDFLVNLAQPDFSLVSLPTTLRLPRMRSAFRLTHRFGRPLGQGSFGDLAGDLFGLDSGAQIGLEYRFGLMAGLQTGIYRTSDKTIQFFGQYDAVRQGDRRPATIDLFLSIEGMNNFREEYSPTVAAVISRTAGTRLALYLEPIWVGHTNLFAPADPDDQTFMIGLGGRWRLGRAVYLVGNWTPRVTGYTPGVSQKTFGIEKRAGGHVFQLNVSNALGTTMGQIARGAGDNDTWHLGFNLSRKFF